MKKISILGLMFLSIIAIFLGYSYLNGQPLDPIREMREGVVENVEALDIIEKELGTMVYSVGEANNGTNYMYSVDMVKHSLTGYKWLGGGGHINQDVPKENHFMMSMQLLNEKQNIYPTFFGVVKDPEINKITIQTRQELVEANFYEGKNGERFYLVSFGENVSDVPFLNMTILYENNKAAIDTISGEDLSILQEGKVFYINKNDLQNFE